MSKLLYYNDLTISNRVVSRFTTLFFLIYYILIIYLLLNIYLLPYYIILIYYNINELRVGSNMIFLCFELATLLFFPQKLCCIGVFCIVFGDFLPQFRKK